MVKMSEIEDLMRRYISGAEEDMAKLEALYWMAWKSKESYGLEDLNSVFSTISQNLITKYGTSRALQELIEELLQINAITRKEDTGKLVWNSLDDSEEYVSSYILKFFEQALLKEYFEKSIRPRLKEALEVRLVRILMYALLYGSFLSEKSSSIDCEKGSCLWKCCKLLWGGEEIDEAEWNEAINALVRSGIAIKDSYPGLRILPYVRLIKLRLKEEIGKIKVEFYE